MEVQWSPSHERTSLSPLLSPTHRSAFDADPQDIRRSLSRSPSRLDLHQLHARLSRRSTPLINRFSLATPPAGRFGPRNSDTPRTSNQQPRSLFGSSRSQNNNNFSLNPHNKGGTGSPTHSNGDDKENQPPKDVSSSAEATPSVIKRGFRRALSTATDNVTSTTSRSSPTYARDQDENTSPHTNHGKKTTNPMIADVPVFKPEPSGDETPRLKARSREWRPAKSSPLKRSDAVMNLNKTTTSKAAKRRTICAGQISSPFETFRDSQESDGDATDSEAEPVHWDVPFQSSLAPGHRASAMSAAANRPRRSFDRPPESPRRSKPGLRQRLRIAGNSLLLDNTAPQPLFPESPVSFQSAESGSYLSTTKTQRPAQPHPLSRTLDPISPTIPFFKNPKRVFQHDHRFDLEGESTKLDFSRSLPLGALRQPYDTHRVSHETSQDSSHDSLETPRRYQLAKPDPAAFRSTGLISKKHRDAEDLPPPPAGNRRMPDTPCKRGLGGFTYAASPTPHHLAFRQPRFAQSSLETPSKPFSQTHRAQPSSLKHTVNMFTNNVESTDHDHGTSYTSIDTEGQNQSSPHNDSQSSMDEMPPTPTKQVTGNKQNSLRSSLFGRHAPLALDTFSAPESLNDEPAPFPCASQDSPCKYIPFEAASGVEEASFADRQDSAQDFIALDAPISVTPLSYAKTRFRRQSLKSENVTPRRIQPRGLQTPSPLRWKYAKSNPLAPVLRPSLPVKIDGAVPRTPADSGFPDPSGLSISPQVSPLATHGFKASGSFTPATPTHRENFPVPATPLGGATPTAHGLHSDMDELLLKRFKKVEFCAEGEFSTVYKVSVAPQQYCYDTMRPDDVYAVKKSKSPYLGGRMRESHLREARIMKNLTQYSSEGADHVVTLIDSWEASGFLYIQTEFCADGTLEQFLDRVGKRDRLDDFRIWKILREMCLGLLHIHGAGYIHLDLKPANILIAFNGALKIADFGLACEWPAPTDTEGEGDRRYIAPELLQGRIDKAADIFALGLIIFEIASNKLLPNNGKSWQKLRSGDWSDLEKSEEKSLTTLPSLTSESTGSLSKDSCSPSPVPDSRSYESLYHVDRDSSMHDVKNCHIDEEVAVPPHFAMDSSDPQSLDSVVHWMMHPDPDQRPTVQQILETDGCQWVNSRSRAAGATIDEGQWGPTPQQIGDQLDQDAEMLDV